jgi:hypothetical protein
MVFDKNGSSNECYPDLNKLKRNDNNRINSMGVYMINKKCVIWYPCMIIIYIKKEKEGWILKDIYSNQSLVFFIHRGIHKGNNNVITL